MKRIVLKPALSIDEIVNFSDAECIVDRIDYHDRCYILKDIKDGLKFKVYFHEIKDIIESPEDQDTTKFDCLPGMWIIKDGEIVNKVSNTGKAAEKSKNCKKCANISSIHNRSIFECKPEIRIQPLKLRVGGIYKDRLGNIVKITEYCEDNRYPYISEDKQTLHKQTFMEDGKFNMYRCVNNDLIEEVQPAKQVSDTKEKPPIKLKVGGVYRLRNGAIEEMELYFKDYDNLEFKGKYCGCYYAVNGQLSWRHILETKNNQWEVIEELTINVDKEIANKTPRVDKPQSEGNPFKVGDVINAYDCCSIIRGTVHRIIDDILWIKDMFVKSRPFHYKQCEVVNV